MCMRFECNLLKIQTVSLRYHMIFKFSIQEYTYRQSDWHNLNLHLKISLLWVFWVFHNLLTLLLKYLYPT